MSVFNSKGLQTGYRTFRRSVFQDRRAGTQNTFNDRVVPDPFGSGDEKVAMISFRPGAMHWQLLYAVSIKKSFER
jgi:hypothetical protein